MPPAIPSRNARARRFLLLITAFLAAGVIASLIPLNYYRADLARIIGRSLGRSVSMESVRLSFVPQPGFNITRLVIQDDAVYGAEPVLRAESVRADLRLASLWSHRLEIASLSMKGVSLNLVRNPDRSWNLERLLLQAAQIPSAPTARVKAEARVRFPYIAVNDGRINFKIGPEKKVFAFSDAEFALWLASENRWNLRLEARPIRTDENLADTGTLTVSGSFDRARTVAETPFHLNISLEKAQLGQWSRLVYGYDRGWHANVRLNSELQGTPAQFSARTNVRLASFRRYDIARSDTLDLEVRCQSKYRKREPQANDGWAGNLDLQCSLPLDEGKVSGQGNIADFGPNAAIDFNLVADQVPLSAVAFLLLHAKSTLPDDLSADGVLNGNAGFTRGASATGNSGWRGILSVNHAVLRSKYLQPELPLGSFSISFNRAITTPAPTLRTRLSGSRLAPQTPGDGIANIVPFDLDLGGSSAAQMSGQFTRTGYELRLHGPADIRRLSQLARSAGVRAIGYDVNGYAYGDVALYGDWKNFAPAQLRGKAELSDSLLSMKGVSEPLTIAAASLSFDPQNVKFRDIDATFNKARLSFAGSIEAQRNCAGYALCNFRFALETQELSSDSIARLLNSSRTIPFPFFSFRRSTPDWYLSLTGEGTISVAHLRINTLEAHNVSAQVVLAPNRTSFRQLRAELLGGDHLGDWTIEFSSGKPVLSGAGAARRIDMQLLSSTLEESWGNGIVDADYRLSLTGNSAEELVNTAAGYASFDWQNGKLVSKSATQDIFAFSDWKGSLVLRDRVIHLEDSRVHSASGVERVSGTVDLNRESDLQFERTKGVGFSLQGPLNSPSIVEMPAAATLGSLHR